MCSNIEDMAEGIGTFSEYQIKRMEQLQGTAVDVAEMDRLQSKVNMPFPFRNGETNQVVMIDHTFMMMCKGGMLGLVTELTDEGLGYESGIIVEEAKHYGRE